MMPIQPPVNPFRVFYMLTGVTFFAFASGFSSCLFDLNQVKECVDYASRRATRCNTRATILSAGL